MKKLSREISTKMLNDANGYVYDNAPSIYSTVEYAVEKKVVGSVGEEGTFYYPIFEKSDVQFIVICELQGEITRGEWEGVQE